MLKAISAITLYTLCINFACAKAVFKPAVIESHEQEVCDLTLAHYSDIYHSKSIMTEGLSPSQYVSIPEFVSREIDGISGKLKTAKADFYGSEKLFVYHQRSHSWRGDIYTGFIIDPEQIKVLEDQLANSKGELSPFYPMGTLAYGSDFTWWENLPFSYKNKWYVLGDFGDFHRHDSVRHVYRISKEGTAQKVCSLKIFQNFDETRMGKQLPFFSAYKRAVEKIMLDPGSCGTSHPEVTAKWNGQLFAAMSIIRPWAVEPAWKKSSNSWEANRIEFQRKHFSDWKFQDIWSYREYETYENLMADAITELKNHYSKHYNYSTADALQLAKGIIDAMPGRYYSLGIYHNQDKDYLPFQQMIGGTYQNWNELQQDLSLKYGNVPLTSLSLMIDNPQHYTHLPASIKKESIISFYHKDLLMFAAHMNNYDSVKFLLDSGWPVTAVTRYEQKYSCDPALERVNRSALTYAAENASLEVIKLLISAGADTEIKDSKGNNLDYYINLNPRFSDDEKKLGFNGLVNRPSTSDSGKPSFSCDQKLNRIETAICNSNGLSIYDRELSKNYNAAKATTQLTSALKQSQRQWIKKRNRECGKLTGNDRLNACLARETRARIRYLEYIHSVFNNATH